MLIQILVLVALIALATVVVLAATTARRRRSGDVRSTRAMPRDRDHVVMR